MHRTCLPFVAHCTPQTSAETLVWKLGSNRSVVWRLKRPRCEGHRARAESQGKLNRNGNCASAAGGKTLAPGSVSGQKRADVHWEQQYKRYTCIAPHDLHIHADLSFICVIEMIFIFFLLWNEHVVWMELGRNSKLGQVYKCSHSVAAVFYSRQLAHSWDMSMPIVYVTSPYIKWKLSIHS